MKRAIKVNFFENQKTFSALYAALTEGVRKKYAITRADFDVLMFLYNNPQYDTAAQVVKYRRLVKSQVSVAVAELVQRGYITAAYFGGNKKTVFLTLTQSGKAVAEEGRRAQRTFAETLFGGFGEEEIQNVKSYLARALDNAERFFEEK